MKGVEQPPQFHPEGDVWIHTLLMLEACRRLLADARLGRAAARRRQAADVHPRRRPEGRIRFDGHVEVGTRMAEEICRTPALFERRYRADRRPRRQPSAIQGRAADEASTLKRFVRLNRFEEHLELHRLDCSQATASWRTMSSCAVSSPKRLPRRSGQRGSCTGDDLKAMGFSPGPRIQGNSGWPSRKPSWKASIQTRDEALRLWCGESLPSPHEIEISMLVFIAIMQLRADLSSYK